MLRLFRAQPVLVIAFAAAAATMFIVPPGPDYAGYINYTVLIELFALMTAVAGLREAGVFDRAAGALIRRVGTVRRLGLLLVLLCFFSSMLLTNDVALITFVPLTVMLFKDEEDEQLIRAVVLETAAANGGSMLTPVGNPQNLFIYEHYGLSAGDFVRAMAPVGLVCLAAIFLLTFLLSGEECKGGPGNTAEIKKAPAAGYSLLFLVCLLAVFREVPVWVCLPAAGAAALVFGPRTLLKVDYGLLMTFLCFFVFVGNLQAIDGVRSLFTGMIQGREVYVGAALSQVISNVPAAFMLSGFTDDGAALLSGVDIGGFGTLIASMASLISFQLYRKSPGARTGRYMAVFSAVNFGILILLLGVQMLVSLV